MTARDLIKELLDYPLDSPVVIQKELDYNIWVNSDVEVACMEGEAVVLTFEWPEEKFEIRRKGA